MTHSGMQVAQWIELDTSARDTVLRRPSQVIANDTRQAVAAVMEDVRTRGDAALRDITARFDKVELAAFEVSNTEFAAAQTAVPAELREAMIGAKTRIEHFHRAGMGQGYSAETAPGVRCSRMIRPISPVGLYVPAGSAPLPSTALMLGVPAALAGCREIILCTPPRPDGSADPAVLVAAQMTSITRVFKLGGAQAIAAMAYGTASVPRCAKLFGPGNRFVTEAKQQAAQSGQLAIDMPAGPSEVLVIADAGANPAFVAADLLSQAEHGPDSQVILISDSAELIAAVEPHLQQQLSTLSRAATARQALASSRAIVVETLEDAFKISNTYAPEHLILALRDAERWLDKVQSAGSVFLGDFTPEALGDYCSGTNHVLPTGGAAQSWSGVSVASFQKLISVQSATRDGIAEIGPSAVTIAEAEGLQAHANAVKLRLTSLPSPIYGRGVGGEGRERPE